MSAHNLQSRIAAPATLLEALKNIWRGWCAGVVSGARIRLPYVIQAAAYVAVFREKTLVERLRFVAKQLVWHGRNLAFFVVIYKSVCIASRWMGVSGGSDSLVAGALAGYFALGETAGVRGAVNNQIVLYLFARCVEALSRVAARRWGLLPEAADLRSPVGFRYFAGFTLALTMWLTDWHPDSLRPGFVQVMDFLYYDTNAGSLRPPVWFVPLVLLITLSMFSAYVPALSLDRLLSYLDPPRPAARTSS